MGKAEDMEDPVHEKREERIIENEKTDNQKKKEEVEKPPVEILRGHGAPDPEDMKTMRDESRIKKEEKELEGEKKKTTQTKKTRRKWTCEEDAEDVKKTETWRRKKKTDVDKKDHTKTHLTV